jgi:hypothetical protein
MEMQAAIGSPLLSTSDGSTTQDTVEFAFSEVHKQLTNLLNDWRAGGEIPDSDSAVPINAIRGEQQLVKVRRELRRDVRDVNAMRATGDLASDENYIPQRIIDQHISEEKPAQINFLEQPDRILVFKDLTDPNQPTGDIEAQFTDHMRDEGWLIPWHRAFDSADLHGGCGLEVVLDDTKPFYSRIEYIRREDLIFPTETTDIQGCEYIMRRYFYMPFELETFVKKYTFDEQEVKNLCKDKDARHKRICVYKVYCKKDGIVYSFWWAESCQKFLTQPAPYSVGVYAPQGIVNYNAQAKQLAKLADQIPPEQLQAALPPPQPSATTDFPIFWLPYEVIEDDRLLSSKGRAFRDKADQEVATQLWSSILNAANRAGDVYASYVNTPGTQLGLQDNQQIKKNTINQREVKFWNFPFPDASLLQIAVQYGNQISSKSSRVDFAVNNRDDSRKTATEIQSAQSQSAAMMSVGISGQSHTIVQIYSLRWQIGLSHILLGVITTFDISQERLLHRYRFGSAGDVDIRKRDEKKQVIRETFQYVAGTPIGNLFLVYMIETFFPERAREWVPVLQQGDPSQIISIAIQLFDALLADPKLAGNLAPEQVMQLTEVVNQMKAYVAASANATGTPNGASSRSVAGTPSNEVTNNLPKEQVGSASGSSPS